jgi:hypothetical protein
MLSSHLPRSWETRDLTEYRSNILYGNEAYQWIVKTLNGPEGALGRRAHDQLDQGPETDAHPP